MSKQIDLMRNTDCRAKPNLYTSSAVFFLSKNPFSFRFTTFLFRFCFVLVSFSFLTFSVFTNAFLTNAFFHKRVFHFSPFSNSANRICLQINAVPFQTVSIN